ncbi:ATPase, partial [Klebsiella variicola]
MTAAGGPPPGAGGYSGPGGQSGPGAHEAPTGGAGAGNGLAAEVQTLERAIFEVKRIIVGQDQLVERMLVGLLSKGHVLLEGVPGVAKTLAVETFAKVVGGTFARIQFTPDLVPTDIIGTRIYRQGKEEFDTELGPVVVNFLL